MTGFQIRMTTLEKAIKIRMMKHMAQLLMTGREKSRIVDGKHKKLIKHLKAIQEPWEVMMG